MLIPSELVPMPSPGSPLFSPKQVRDLLALPNEQLRNWRKLLPSIGRDRSGQAVFDFADLLAFAIVRRLVVDAGVRIGLLEPVAHLLVEICASMTLEEAPRLRLEFEPEIERVAVRPIDAPTPHTLVVLVPLGPIVKSLIARLTLPPDGPDGLPLFRQ